MHKNLLILLLGTALVLLFFSTGQILKPPSSPPDSISPEVTLPSFTLTNQNEQVLTAHHFEGYWTLIFFAYTHCDAGCVDIASDISFVAENINQKQPEQLVKPLLISIDPERDGSAELQEFVQEHAPALEAATAAPDEIEALATQLSIIYNREPGTSPHDRKETARYHFDHSLNVLLFDPNGQLAHTFYPEHNPSAMIQTLNQHIQDFTKMPQKSNPVIGKVSSSLLYALPHHLISRAVYHASRIETPWIKNTLISGYSRLFSLNMDEAVESDPKAYPSLNALFTRALKPEARPVFSTGNSLHASADGVLSEFGNVEQGKLIQAKGYYYSAEKLLGDTALAAPFLNGQYHTIYLSPNDYHRVHMPITGILTDMVYVPGRLFSVSPTTTRNIPELFTRNERVIAFFDTEHGRMALVLVGAINVAAIETVWAGLVTPPQGDAIKKQTYTDRKVIKAGEEMGRFNMGSTVVVVTEKGFGWLDGLNKGMTVKMGETLANRD